MAAEHGIGQNLVGLHPLPQRGHGGAAQINGGRDLARKVGNNARICFQKWPTQLLNRSWASKSDANGRTVKSVELATVVAGHGGGCSLATAVAGAGGHCSGAWARRRLQPLSAFFPRDRIKDMRTCIKKDARALTFNLD